MKFLVIQQKMIGDVLTSSILCENLKRIFPGCRVDFVANDTTLPVIAGNPYIDNVIVFRKEYRKSKTAFLKFLRTFGKTSYDVLIDAYGKTESNLISWFSPAKTKISYYKWYTHFLYTHALKRYVSPEPGTGLAVANRLLLLKPLLREDIPLITRPKIYLDARETEQAKRFLETHRIDPARPLVMLSVLGSDASKTYPLPYMAKVIGTVARHSEATLLFNYIPAQSETAKALYLLCDPAAQARIKFNVFAPSLRDFLGLLYHCKALIGNEGGAVNMAKALEVPTFSIFSPWIAKEAWDLFGDRRNVAVHLRDVEPGAFEAKKQKELRKRAPQLYERFTPERFEDELQRFLNTVLK
ncbi:MAG: glycosyltransferase family 9 protein [Sinomicrobium sp.]|nr:glycosyltransferase family 9 protein [Sinomicrobium sp.]